MLRTQAIVFIHLDGRPVPAGRLEMVEDGRWSRAGFTYGKRYLEKGHPALDPVQLPLSDSRLETGPDFAMFNGLRDSAPDFWGRSLIDMHVMHHHARPASEAEHLMGSTSSLRFGALCYGRDPREGPSDVMGLDLPVWIVEPDELNRFQTLLQTYKDTRNPPKALLPYIQPGSDMGGARPKATLMLDGFPWLAKFSRPSDRLDILRAEAACLDLCELAGLQVPERQLVHFEGFGPALLLKRFDRRREPGTGPLLRHHVLSALTLLGAHENDLGLHGYADIFDALRKFGSARNRDIGKEIFSRMAMNMLCGNSDDHSRNHAFILQEDGGYAPAPVYDVMPTLQASSQRNLFFHLGKAGSGREATLDRALAAAPAFGLSLGQGRAILSRLHNLVARHWRPMMHRRGLSLQEMDMLAPAFAQAEEPGPEWSSDGTDGP